MHTELLGRSANGHAVSYDTQHSHAATHFADSPGLKELVRQVIPKITLEGDVIEFDHEMGYVVGTTDLVANQPGDKIVYAKRLNRDIYTPFNKTQAPQPSTKISLSFATFAGGYLLHSAWIGDVASPSMPGDSNQTAESIPFWNSHSLVWGSQAIQHGAETDICPW